MNSQWIGPVSRKIVIALAFAAAASAASAAAVATPGDPFPAGSIVNLSPSFSSAFGTISLAFGDFDLVGHTGSLFNYNAELIATVSGTTYDLPGQFEVTVAGLANPVVDGQYTVAFDSGTFQSTIGTDAIVVTGSTSLPTSGTSTYTGSGANLEVNTSVTLNLKYTVNGGSPIVVPTQTGSTTAVPEPSTWAMLLAGFAGLGFASYRSSRRSGALAA
ncbi:putative secreted protein with PEP-CTERM sorting signal [Roseiarcus fermentans]|uniref:Putative secreted protein with PEP-CTERM sorting signal n=1 Tax=Roseiarcus fermentans TaxID=1473586 RepID=A0A366EQ86_9HYPH|nr:PEP-CTERM sorting domain-containing protein [Roseiarcus fermentans]RBP04531.1 putative secreted protein with PEP-CTERM sorting signal [Roseiarcus fermentans]